MNDEKLDFGMYLSVDISKIEFKLMESAHHSTSSFLLEFFSLEFVIDREEVSVHLQKLGIASTIHGSKEDSLFFLNIHTNNDYIIDIGTLEICIQNQIYAQLSLILKVFVKEIKSQFENRVFEVSSTDPFLVISLSYDVVNLQSKNAQVSIKGLRIVSNNNDMAFVSFINQLSLQLVFTSFIDFNCTIIAQELGFKSEEKG